MTPVTIFRGKMVAIFGLGSSGLATCAALAAGGARVVAWDDQAAKIADAKAKGYATEDLRALDWGAVAALVLAPGVPLTHPKPHWAGELARTHRVEVIGDIELFCRERRANAPDAPFVAITGTNGKSTTTALLAHVLKSAGRDVQVGGNLGTPILSLAPPAANRTHVIECSSFQIDLAPSLDPTVGILLNLTPDHLDRHGTMENYAAIKERLTAGAEFAVIGVDDEFCRAIANRLDRAGKRVVGISVDKKLADGIFLEGAQNAAAAFAAARALGVEPAKIAAALKTFPGLAHRMEEVGRKGAILFVNDSKATNADAAARALASFSDIFWIAGGRAKEGGLSGLEPFYPRIRKAYLIGEAAEAFAKQLEATPHVVAGTLDRAVGMAKSDAEVAKLAHPVVLLSPACASYDQFPNFEVRGDRFRELVRAIPGVEPIREAAA
jgi:UDP-N-acetylmuramoylalanine--D-glutamate ligase